MSQKTIRVAVSVAVVLTAIVGLMSLSLGETAAYYKHVDEVMAAPEQWYQKNLQLHGHVVDGSIMRRPNTLDYKFSVEANGKVVHATYSGVIPDTFKSGSEVVLRGQLSPAGFAVQPKDGIMAKCPSKYEAKPAYGAPGAAPAGKSATGGSR